MSIFVLPVANGIFWSAQYFPIFKWVKSLLCLSNYCYANVDNHVVGRAPSILSICPCWHIVACLALQGTSDKINSLCLRDGTIINWCLWRKFVFMFFRFTYVKRTLWSSNRLWLFNAFFSATAADSILAKPNNEEEKSGHTKITFGLCFWPIFSWCE